MEHQTLLNKVPRVVFLCLSELPVAVVFIPLFDGIEGRHPGIFVTAH